MDAEAFYRITADSPELASQDLESELTAIAAKLSTLLARGTGNVTCRSYMRTALTCAQDAVRTVGLEALDSGVPREST